MSEQTEHMLPDIISKALALPVVRVDRRTFLTKLFPHATEVELMSILKDGPQAVYTLEQLTKVARRHARYREDLGDFICRRIAFKYRCRCWNRHS